MPRVGQRIQVQRPREQRRAIANRNVLELIAAGGNIYYLAKFAGILGLDVQDLGAAQTGMTKEAFKAKLLAAAGAWLGAEALPSVVLMAAVSALLLILGARIAGHKLSSGDAIPFGPFLALGTWIAWIHGTF